ncbi:MAG: hypothetical protein JSS66_04370 [Armatimonadetes bacterium]|nr:hypothetical protein [Armatimonadota bacterium]
MKRISMIGALLALGLMLSLPSFAQTSTTKSSTTTKAPAGKVQKSTSTKSKTMTMAGSKVSGIVSGSVTNKMFKLGSKSGTYTVDASSARCTMNGKFISLNDIKGGTMVTVMGKVNGKSIKADSVKVNYMKGMTKTTAKTTKPTTATTIKKK